MIDVEVADPGSVGSRLDGMSAAEAAMAVEQVIYTVQAAANQTLPVQFTHGVDRSTRCSAYRPANPSIADRSWTSCRM